MSEFEYVSLSNLVEEIIDNRGRTCPTSEQGIPLIATNCVKEDRIYPTHEKVRYVSDETYDEWFRGHPIPGDILFVNKGSPGRVCLVPDPIDFCIAQDMVALRANKRLVCPQYLFAALRSPQVKASIDNMNVGTMIPHFKKGDFDKLLIPVPDRGEQESIGNIYYSFSLAIENKRKTNETLEAMAKALFKSWFVDFDPVRAKAEGRPTGLPAEISDLFPDSFQDSELGEIPSGWKVEQLGEVIELAYGKPLKEEQRNGGSYPVFGSNGVVGSHDEYLVEAPGIVVGRKGNPGTVEWSEKNFYPIDTTFFVIKKKGGLGMRFLFYCLKNQNLSNLSADSAVPGLNRNHAYMNNQLLPPAEVAFAFERQLEVIFNRKAFLAEEINTLGATRDALLPKLISGEIRIPDAEKMLEEVGV